MTILIIICMLQLVSRRLESKGPKTCKFVIVANLEFVTKTMMRGKIETELWSGQQKSVGLLKEHLKAAETPSPSPVREPAADLPKHDLIDNVFRCVGALGLLLVMKKINNLLQ